MDGLRKFKDEKVITPLVVLSAVPIKHVKKNSVGAPHTLKTLSKDVESPGIASLRKSESFRSNGIELIP
jgi:hypothetical protein